MKAETTRRPERPAWASAFLMKWTRQRCQVALRTLATAVFRPSCASETTSFTPRSPRRASLRRNAVQKVSASEGPMSRPSTSRRQALGALLAIRGAGQAADLQLHEALGGEADHLAQQVRVRALLQEPAQVHHLVGHRWVLD